MSVFTFPFPYDEAIDPTPEDKEFTDRDKKIILLDELRNLAPEDLSKYQALRIPLFEELFVSGIETEHGLVHPAPVFQDIDEWDDEGFAVLRDEDGNESFFTQDRRMYETALRWRQSGNRLLKKGHDVLRQTNFLLPLKRFVGNEAFEAFYLKNLTCFPRSPMISSKSGYFSRSVFAEIVEEEVERGGRTLTEYIGKNPIDGHVQPLAGSTPEIHLANIMEAWNNRWGRRGGPGYDNVIEVVVPGIVFDADRKVEERYEGWTPPSPIFHFNRAAEIDHAKSNDNY